MRQPVKSQPRLLAITLLLSLCSCGGSPSANDEPAVPKQDATQEQSYHDCEQEGESRIRIGVFYIDNATGKSHLEGIKEGIEDGIEEHDLREQVCVKEYPYVNEREAIEKFRQATGREHSEPEVDIILGPTESDVFVRMREESRGLTSERTIDESNQNSSRDNDVPVPVVSGLVTTTVGNEPTGWFFRTNVDVTRRAETLHSYINKYWINSIAIMYANTEFGSRAEKAFAEHLPPAAKKRYLPLIYDSPPRPKAQLDKILDSRPEAVGFFGEREDIKQIYLELQERNGHGASYHPIFFTLLDAGPVDHSVQDLVYVSVAPNEDDAENRVVPDDVVALGHDTAVLTLNILSRIDGDADKGDLRLQFRNRLATRLKRSERQPGTLKQMRFTNYENSSRLVVYERTSAGPEAVDLTRTINPLRKLASRIGLVFSVWGWWPILGTMIIAAITGFVVYSELYRLFEGTTIRRHVSDVVKSKFFRRMAVPHFVVALVIYVTLAETGNIQFDNLAMVVVVAFGPWALLKSMLETPLGERTGLKRYVEEWKSRVDNELMKERFKGRQAAVNVITYGNSQFAMRNALLDLYRSHPSPTESSRLIQELEQKLQSEQQYFERRRICARLLLKQKTWDELRAEGLVPFNCEEDRLIDPQKIVRAAAKLCARESKLPEVRQLVSTKLEVINGQNPERHDELKKLLDAELKDTISSEGRLNVYIRFLFVLFNFDIERLKQLMSEGAYKEFIESLETEKSDKQAFVNVIAYRNSQSAMKNALLDLYRSHPSPTESNRLIEELEQKLKSEQRYLERRRICARLLLRLKTWDELRAEGFVPLGCEEDRLVDPQKIVRAAAKLCARESKLPEIRQLVTTNLAVIHGQNQERFDELKKILDAELKDTISSEGRLIVYIRFLFVLFNFDIKQLKQIMSKGAYEELVESLEAPLQSPQRYIKLLIRRIRRAFVRIVGRIRRILRARHAAPEARPAETDIEVATSIQTREADSREDVTIGENESDMEEKERQMEKELDGAVAVKDQTD